MFYAMIDSTDVDGCLSLKQVVMLYIIVLTTWMHVGEIKPSNENRMVWRRVVSVLKTLNIPLEGRY
jgi:hypothetical protein